MQHIKQRAVQYFFLLHLALLQGRCKIDTDTALLILGSDAIAVYVYPVDQKIDDGQNQLAAHQFYYQLGQNHYPSP